MTNGCVYNTPANARTLTNATREVCCKRPHCCSGRRVTARERQPGTQCRTRGLNLSLFSSTPLGLPRCRTEEQQPKKASGPKKRREEKTGRGGKKRRINRKNNGTRVSAETACTEPLMPLVAVRFSSPNFVAKNGVTQHNDKAGSANLGTYISRTGFVSPLRVESI